MTEIQKVPTTKEQFMRTAEHPNRGKLMYEIHDNNEVSCILDTSGKTLQEPKVYHGVFECDDAFRQFLEDNNGVETKGLNIRDY